MSIIQLWRRLQVILKYCTDSLRTWTSSPFFFSLYYQILHEQLLFNRTCKYGQTLLCVNAWCSWIMEFNIGCRCFTWGWRNQSRRNLGHIQEGSAVTSGKDSHEITSTVAYSCLPLVITGGFSNLNPVVNICFRINCQLTTSFCYKKEKNP